MGPEPLMISETKRGSSASVKRKPSQEINFFKVLQILFRARFTGIFNKTPFRFSTFLSTFPLSIRTDHNYPITDHFSFFIMGGQPTEEQQNIITAVHGGSHVCVTALPGSGKSTVAYGLINQCVDDTHVILIMYNRSLADSTNSHIAKMKLPTERHVKAFTFHGLASALTGEPCHNDRQLTTILSSFEPKSEPWNMAAFTLLIIDESQDMRPGFFQLIRLLIEQVCTRRQDLRIVLLGDPNQLLYHFYNHNRADARFLTLGPQLLRRVNSKSWQNQKLTRSFRSCPPVSQFLNALLPNHDMVPREINSLSCKPVSLILCRLYSDPSSFILPLLATYAPSDVMILSSSLNEFSPAKHIVHALVKHGIPVHVSRSGRLSDVSPPTLVPLSTGKLRVKTFCAAKGLEAKLVIVLNHRSLFEKMENSLYVALTRSSEQLIIFQDASTTTHSDIEELSTKLERSPLLQIQIHRTLPVTSPPERENRPTQRIQVDGMFNYVDPVFLLSLEKRLHVTSLEESFADEDQYTKVCNLPMENDRCTNVQNITSLCLRLSLEYFRLRRLPRSTVSLDSNPDPFIRTLYKRATHVLRMHLIHDPDPWSIQQMIFKLQAFAMLATALDSMSGFSEKLHDVQDFSFVVSHPVMKRFVRICHYAERFVPILSTSFSHRKTKCLDKIQFISQPTLYNEQDNTILSIIHKPSTDGDDLLVMGMHLVVHEAECGILCNIYTGEIVKVTLLKAQHSQFLQDAIYAKTCTEDDLPDQQFIQRFEL
jgi:hypothetical protein